MKIVSLNISHVKNAEKNSDHYAVESELELM